MPTPVRAATPKPRKPKPRKGSYKVTKPTSVALRLVRPWIVDRVVRWAQSRDVCDEVNQALTLIFGKAPQDGWRDSDGFDCDGYDVDGYDVDGYNRLRRNAAGVDAAGYDVDGWNAAGTNRWGYVRNTTDVEELLKRIPLAVRPILLAKLTNDSAPTSL